ncbi:MAG: ankyrin repeat domain-containing protein [Sulfuritalea sp.]|nr:ankyrin repeat domain-containing protein [Sulfuritalea sp.]MDP1984897.1 ankyrin repeat domain-containing protein [Sulfuritalea sp.]
MKGPAAWLHSLPAAAVNARDGEGSTPLHMAAFSTRTENVKLLLQAGTDPALKTDVGRDVLSLARKVRADELARRTGRRNLAVDTQGLQSGQVMLKTLRGVLLLLAATACGAPGVAAEPSD